MRAIVLSFLKPAPALSPWPLFFSQLFPLPTSLPPSHLPGPTPALHPACIFPGLISFFPLSRLLPAASANFPQLEPLPLTAGGRQLGVGEDVLLFPSPGWGWGVGVSAIHPRWKAGVRGFAAGGRCWLAGGCCGLSLHRVPGGWGVWDSWGKGCPASGTRWSKRFASCFLLKAVTPLPFGLETPDLIPNTQP